MDAITLLREDHKNVKKLFREFEKTTARASVTRRELVAKMIEELSVHAAVEEQLFYPAVRQEIPEQAAMALESIEEHHIVKWVLSELENRDPADERFEPKVTVLMELVRHHIEEEENDLFPAVRQALGRKRLSELGQAMAELKKAAPTRPHPRSPDTPPGNLIAAPLAAAADKAREVVGSLTR